MILGWGAWGLAIVPGVWGLRFALHLGEARGTGRLIFAPIWLALLSMYAATLAPGPDWAGIHSFGLGGLFGDTVLGTVLGVLPLGAGLGLKLLSGIMGIAVLAFGAFVLGFTRPELQRIGRFLLLGVVVSYAALLRGLGRGARGTAQAAQTLRARRAERRAQGADAVIFDDDAPMAEAPRVRRAEPALRIDKSL